MIRYSVIIPARNEESNLPRCLNSVPKREDVEVLVIDDGSQDRTAALAKELGAIVHPAPPKPEGWTGKTWACQYGSEKAVGSCLLFMDADTFFLEGAWERIDNKFRERGERPLSILPYHLIETFYEELSLYFNLIASIGVLGDGRLAGQFLLITRRDYDLVGGHACVKNSPLENVFLARALKSSGVTSRCIAGRDLVGMRMYPAGFRSMTEGWAKSFALGSKAMTVPRWILAYILCAVSWRASGSLALALSDVVTYFSQAAYFFTAVFLFYLGRRVGNFRIGLLFPVAFFYFVTVFLLSLFRLTTGRKSTWKGRSI